MIYHQLRETNPVKMYTCCTICQPFASITVIIPPPHTHTKLCVCVEGGRGGGRIITVMLAKGCQMGHVINILINLSQPHTTLHNTFIPPRLKLVKGLTINKQYYLINILSNIMQKKGNYYQQTIINYKYSIFPVKFTPMTNIVNKSAKNTCTCHTCLNTD